MENQNNQLANSFASILAQAAKAPAETGATAHYKNRFENASQAVVVLADVSSSMSERAGSKRKIEILETALCQVLEDVSREILIAFSSTPVEIPIWPLTLPQPNGGTALHLALDAAACHKPTRTLVISDGQPDNEEAALAAAEKITGRIDVIYVGPDDDTRAIAFMNKLARVGGGRVVVEDMVKNAARPQLAAAMRGVLALPEGGAK